MRHIPNALSIFRIFIALGFPFLPEGYQSPAIVVALITEFMDGFLARAFGWTSRVGEVLDPIADKIFFFCVGATWVISRVLTWQQLILLSSREIGVFMIAMFIFLAGKHKTMQSVKALFFGKVTTALQYLTFIIVIWLGHPLNYILALTFVTGIISTIQYAILIKRKEYGET